MHKREKIMSQEKPLTVVASLNALTSHVKQLKRQDALWDTADIGAYMGLAVGTVRNHVVKKPGFPPCIILPTGGRRWHSKEVKQWILSCGENRRGLP